MVCVNESRSQYVRLREGRGSISCTAPPRLDKRSTTASSRPRSGREATCQGKRRGHVSWREDGPKALIREWHTPPRSHDTPPRKEEEEEEKQQFPDVPVSFHSSSSSPICPFLAPAAQKSTITSASWVRTLQNMPPENHIEPRRVRIPARPVRSRYFILLE